MGEALTRALRYHAWWMGADEQAVEVRPNMDYVSAKLSPDEPRAYMELLNNGRISYQTFYALLKDQRLADKAVDGFVQLINERSGLLVERGQGVYAFSHLTFQEYLAARAVSASAPSYLRLAR